jgi:hypothetical protein
MRPDRTQRPPPRPTPTTSNPGSIPPAPPSWVRSTFAWVVFLLWLAILLFPLFGRVSYSRFHAIFWDSTHSTRHNIRTTAIPFDGGVVMGADSRTSTGTYIAVRVSDKITQVHDRIWICRSGSAADTQALTDYIRHYLGQLAVETGRAPTVKTAAHLMRRLIYENKDNLMAGVIVGGWDSVEGGSVYNIPLGGTMIKMPFGECTLFYCFCRYQC